MINKVKIYYIVLIFYGLHGFQSNAQSVFIIIHGTWGSDSSWYLPGGDFFQELELCVKKIKGRVVPFYWSGKNRNDERIKAAHNFAKLVQSYDKDTRIFVVGHSHGGNVATIASQFLGKDRQNIHTIEALFVLGTPIAASYQPDMNIINFVYNFVSFEDLVQPVCGLFGREYEKHSHITNIRLFINGMEPGHSELHDRLLARWLLSVHKTMSVAQKKIVLQNHVFYTLSLTKSRASIMKQDGTRLLIEIVSSLN